MTNGNAGAFEAVISGRVQGVTYRDFALKHAMKLNISGEVQNLPDGKVRVYAEADEHVLNSFLTLLRKGPFFARVEDVSVAWMQPRGGFSGFFVQY